MAFRIHFDSTLLEVETTGETASGEIVIDEFRETFISPLDYWNEAQYERQWGDTLIDLSRGTKKTGCLITSIQRPSKRSFVTVWAIYVEDEIAYIQNLLLDVAKEYRDFDEHYPEKALPARATIDEDENPISIWRIAAAELYAQSSI